MSFLYIYVSLISLIYFEDYVRMHHKGLPLRLWCRKRHIPFLMHQHDTGNSEVGHLSCLVQ